MKTREALWEALKFLDYQTTRISRGESTVLIIPMSEEEWRRVKQAVAFLRPDGFEPLPERVLAGDPE